MSEPFYVSSAGIRHYWDEQPDGSVVLRSEQDVEAMLDLNKAMANENDGYTPSRDMVRLASIPAIVWLKWLNEDGINAYDPENADYLMRKLNDSDWRWLRTGGGHLAMTQDGRFR